MLLKSFMVPFLIRRCGYIIALLIASIFCIPQLLPAYDNINAHPHIAKQAFKVWPNDTSHEIYQYLGMNYFDMSTEDAACNNAKTGSLIAEGAKEEDDYDPLGQTCVMDWHNGFYGFYHHFFNPFIPEPNGLQNALVGYGWNGALWQAQAYWNQAKVLYSIEPINKPLAYWYLGRIAHLLADVSVPAHVHNDMHALECFYEGAKDSYEFYMSINFLKYTSSRVTDFNLLPSSLTLDAIFTQSAIHSATYPSDDVEGTDSSRDSWNDDKEWCGVLYDQYISDSNLNVIASDLMPQAIKYTAALYRMFWREFHADIEGPSQFDIFTTQTFSVLGKPNGVIITSWEWDFDGDGDYDDASGRAVSHTFKQANAITIGVRLNGDPGMIITKQINIIPPKITVEFPNGFEDLYRRFSTPENDLISTYSWNYGDGSPVEEGPSHGNTFPTSGYYTVTLTLTLDDGSTIQSEAGIFVGPGTRYIQGHTIYGEETWYSGGTYVVQGSITVAEGASLTIEPGVRVELNSGVSIFVAGSLTATDVTFTWADGVNQWGGIYFENAGASGSRLENCIIEHGAGTYLGIGSGVIKIYNASPTITGCAISNSNAENGISIQDATPTITGNSISGFPVGINLDDLHYDWSSAPTVTGNTISSNTTGIIITSRGGGSYYGNTIRNNNAYGIYYSGTTIINATACNWGDATGPLDDSDDRASGGWYNPNGLGDKVSDHVKYAPWIIPADDDNDGLSNDLENDGCTHPNDADTDDDGIIDGVEDGNHNGNPDTGETNPCNIDTDGDGIQDGTEMGLTAAGIGPGTDTTVFQPDMNNATTTNPLDADSDNDGLTDGQEDLNHNGRVDAGETNPNVVNGKAMPWIPLLLLD